MFILLSSTCQQFYTITFTFDRLNIKYIECTSEEDPAQMKTYSTN